MTDNEATINAFYTAFSKRDHEAMGRCYDRDIRFSDPVFGSLRGNRARAMWHMLCEQGNDLHITHSDVDADDRTGSAHWEAIYSFGSDKRRVHNRVNANFTFKAGKIVTHDDRFDLWAWSRMALGPTGIILGWSGFVKRKVRATAKRSLDRFVDGHPEYTESKHSPS